jgi:hypothetical protein
MLRAFKGVDLADHLHSQDLSYLRIKIDPDAWYPMATFERLGNAILKLVAKDNLGAVELWGRYSGAQLRNANPLLVAVGDPVETLNSFKVLRDTFFDFEALKVLFLYPDEAQILIRYHMGKLAEGAAAFQTKGFFEGLLELAGAKQVSAAFRERSWAGDRRTRLELHWTTPHT